MSQCTTPRHLSRPVPVSRTPLLQPNYTPLHTAAYHGHEGCVVRLLCAQGIVWTRVDRLGNTAADKARVRGHHGIAQVLDKWKEQGSRYDIAKAWGFFYTYAVRVQ